jgi:hypothetical protein
MVQHNDNEIDIIELIGVIIKWRKVLIIFVATVTVFAGIVIGFKNYNKYEKAVKEMESELGANRNGGKAGVVEVRKDPLNYIFKFVFKPNENKTDYDTFVSRLLFPEDMEKPVFDVAGSVKAGGFKYTFVDNSGAEIFKARYLELISTLKRLVGAKEGMTNAQFAQCLYILSRQTTGNAVYPKNCADYIYFQTYISDKISYAINASTPVIITTLFLEVVSKATTALGDNGVISGPEILTSAEKKNLAVFMVGDKGVQNIKKMGILKPVALVFVLSIFFAVFLAFVLEFWVKNKDRIRKYF